MKIVQLLIVCMCLVNISILNAQKKKKNHISHQEMDNIAGTWEWQSGDSIMIVKFKKAIMSTDEFKELKDYSEDVLIGCHCLKVDGSVVQSSLENFDMPYEFRKSKRKYTLEIMAKSMGGNVKRMNLDYFFDLETGVEFYGGHVKVIANGKKLKLYVPKVCYEAGYSIDDPTSKTFSMPNDIILTKKN